MATAWEKLATEAIADAREWKARAYKAEADRQNMRAALAHIAKTMQPTDRQIPATSAGRCEFYSRIMVAARDTAQAVLSQAAP